MEGGTDAVLSNAALASACVAEQLPNVAHLWLEATGRSLQGKVTTFAVLPVSPALDSKNIAATLRAPLGR